MATFRQYKEYIKEISAQSIQQLQLSGKDIFSSICLVEGGIIDKTENLIQIQISKEYIINFNSLQLYKFRRSQWTSIEKQLNEGQIFQYLLSRLHMQCHAKTIHSSCEWLCKVLVNCYPLYANIFILVVVSLPLKNYKII